MSKVTVIGAGMVGATCANVLAARNVADEVVLIDIKVSTLSAIKSFLVEFDFTIASISFSGTSL